MARRKARWTRYDTRLALASLTALIIIGLLALAPVWLLYTVIGVWLLLCVVAMVWLFRAASGPLTDFDRECSRIDDELEAREARERMVRRLARQNRRLRARGGGWHV